MKKRSSPMKVKATFEPNRLSNDYLGSAYETIIPIHARQLLHFLNNKRDSRLADQLSKRRVS
jgi:hypothetical protein